MSYATMHILGGESYALKKLESYTVEAYCSHSVITGLFNSACDIRRMLVIHAWYIRMSA